MANPATTILMIVTLFAIKHFLADYLLQTDYIATYKGTRWDAMAMHLIHHAIFTAVIVISIPFIPLVHALLIVVTEVAIHGIVDTVKASPRFLNQYTPKKKIFWTILGIDQLLHQITYIGITWYIFT